MVFTIMNIKGGVAKTTSVINLATVVSLTKKKVLVIDVDIQGDTTDIFYDKQKSDKDIRSLLIEDASLEEVIKQTAYENIDIIPCGPKHVLTLSDLYRMGDKLDYQMLRKKLEPIRDKYDCIIIDTSPAGLLMTDLALAASDYVITPAIAEGFSYKGMKEVVKQIYYIQSEYNDELVYLGSFLTFAQHNTKLFKFLYNNYRKRLRTSAISTFIRMDNTLREAATNGVPVYYYTKRSKAGADYIRLAAEIDLISKRDCNKLLETYGADNFDFDNYIKEVVVDE